MRGSAAPGASRAGELGFTLIELVIVVALLALIAGSACASLAQRPANVRSNSLQLASLIARARALAAVTGAATLDGGSGASIGVERDGDASVATLYAYRPIRGAQRQPAVVPNSPPLRLTTALMLDAGAGQPFALFFSPAGHASALAGYRIGTSQPLATEPACPLATGIALTVSDSTQAQHYVVNCVAGPDTLP